ncbi:MAG: alpha-ribazole phosphatase family protein [Burkholderiales bacterium]|nr:alpha-ribazole phosphatase family protein [Burkholderiales bacterium]
MSDTTTLVTVMRHGAVDGPANVLRGSSDVPLSDTGWNQMRAACAALDTPVTAITSSPLSRCRAFAQELAMQHALPLNLHDDLREIHFGDWENLTPDAARASTPILFDQFISTPAGMSPPNGELFDAFKQRVLAAFHASLAQAGAGHLLIVTHAGVMRVLLSSIMNLPWADTYRIALPPAGNFRLSCLSGHAPYLFNLNTSCAI